MAPLSAAAASRLTLHTSPFALCFLIGAASIGFSFAKSVRRSLQPDQSRTVPSPQENILPHLSKDEIDTLPYPPHALPGARDVESPYGSFRVYEWGPEKGPRVLLVHGISTPSIALGGLASKLVEKGCRVMLFDLYGRGYSAAPDPDVYRYDSALYTAQILLCLQSSALDWRPFTLIGYSLGGAIAADFTSYLPHLIDGLFLIAPGGLIRTHHITWKSRLLYSTSQFLPEWFIERLVAGRLWTGPETARSIEPESDTSTESEGELKGGLRGQAVYTSSHLQLLPGNPNSTVGKVVDWQIQNHKGFVPAFISSIRYAPIHGQQARWRLIKEHIHCARSGPSDTSVLQLRKVHVILGETDPIILAEEITEDVTDVLGTDVVHIQIMIGVGHEVAIEKADEIGGFISEHLHFPSKSANVVEKKPSSPLTRRISHKRAVSEVKQPTTADNEAEASRAPSTPKNIVEEEKENSEVKDSGGKRGRADSTGEQHRDYYNFKARRLFETDVAMSR